MIKNLLRKYKRQILLIFSLVIASGVLLFASIYAGFWGPVPTVTELKEHKLDRSTEILADQGELLGKIYIDDRQPVSFDSIPKHVIEALIATEDARFYDHRGVDTKSLFRVFIKTILLQDESSGGGSTLSQQLAKNLYPRKNLGTLGIVIHKIRESIIARRLEKVFDKKEILTAYLNTVPFSDNKFGIESASRHFFNKPVSALDISQASTLIGSLKATYYYNPRLHPERSYARKNVVLHQMTRYDFLDTASFNELRKDTVKLQLRAFGQNTGLAPYFRERVRREAAMLLANYNKEQDTLLNLYKDGLKIYTTVDYGMQELAEEAMTLHMNDLQQQFEASYGKNAPWKGNTPLVLAEVRKLNAYKQLKQKGLSEPVILDSLSAVSRKMIFTGDSISEISLSTIDSLRHYLKTLNCGSVALDPYNGAVKTWIGGVNYESLKFDHVTQSKRQPGSTFKPIIYTAALENGISPCTYYPLKAVTYENLEDWTPTNSGNKDEEEDYMNYSLKYALSHSVNTIAVKVMEDVGIQNVIQTARALGITSPLPEVPSLALGTAELSVLELAGAYSAFINSGHPVMPFFIKRIEDSQGRVIYRHTSEEKSPTVISETTRQLMLEMMKAVVEEGTAKRLRTKYALTNDIAGKTGTTQNNKDGWFVGLTPKLVSVSWVGLDNHKLGFKNTAIGQGANAALPLFALWMKSLSADDTYNNITQAEFTEPDKEVLSSLDCDPKKRDGFFKRLFTNPDKVKKKKFKTETSD